MNPNKALGQNFLKDRQVLRKIIEAADLSADDKVIEVGPGEGALTNELIKRAGKVIGIEKDAGLAEKLADNFQFSILNSQSIHNFPILNFKKKAAIISGDILKINLPEIIKQNDFLNYKVIANIPYYITSPIMQLFLETKYPPKEMILMVQKEVAERICAKPGDMSLLAVSVQYYAKAEKLFNVPKTAFWPVPEVDSAVIRVTHTLERVSPEGRKLFFRIVRAGFSSRRKTLLNNFSGSFHLDKKSVEAKLKKTGIDPIQRAQELSMEEWKKLAGLF